MKRAASGSTFGEKVQWLLQARERQGTPPTNEHQLAELIGHDSGTIYKWKRLRTRPRADIGRKVAQALGISYDVLTDDTRTLEDLEKEVRLDALLRTLSLDDQRDLADLLSREHERSALLVWWRTRRGTP